MVVGVTFFALAVYVVGQVAWTLYVGAAPAESMLGIVLALASLVVMPLVAWGRSGRVARVSSTPAEEGYLP